MELEFRYHRDLWPIIFADQLKVSVTLQISRALFRVG